MNIEGSVVLELKWWHFSQNNSGGYYHVDDMLAQDVFIQATSALEAQAKAEELFEDSSHDYCECCGERWSTYYCEEEDGKAQPMIYDTIVFEYGGWKAKDKNEYRLHFYDGAVVKGFVGKYPQEVISHD